MTRKFTPLTRPKSLDFYSIYEDNGVKHIRIFGYSYESDCYWAMMECGGFVEPLADFIAHVEENEDYVNDTYADLNQYQEDYTAEEMVNAINHYFDGHCAGAYLGFGFITEDTPCGDYVC